ncbi:ABC transporter permease subunit [Dehalobacter restrictus]|uniref:ABC transporter permease n=1 Tax=Dehalobacter restrictus (strain DSM 9455 / PER-K23) TaxID=871738 RepID=A0ABM5P6X1_DEHRP|nr:ABC transporter permease subunit [Dehalobacter restrictus]AHF10436.1 ABC transporter permease [Dehalobacter restrictus DSM 9455]
MNIVLHELKAYRKSIIIWACSMTLLAVLYIFLFKGLGHDIENFKAFLNNMPDVIKKSFNIFIDSISTLEGFYSFVFSFVVLCGAIQAMNLGTAIVSKEMRDRTADFLMTKPVSRSYIMTSKLIAAFSALVMTNIIYLGLTVSAAVALVGTFNLKVFFMISVTMFFVQLIFMALGVLISVMAGRIKSVISVSLSTVFGFYILGSLGSFLGEEKVRYFSPFRYFDTAYIIKHAAYEVSFVVIGIVFIIAAIAGSYLVYLKKDIHVA